MAIISTFVQIHDPRVRDMRFHVGDGVFYLNLVNGDVGYALGTAISDREAEAEAMDRLAEMASKAATWLRSGDLPEHDASGGAR